MLPGDDDQRGSLGPFVAAAAVFVLVVVGIAVFTLTRGDGLTEQQRVGRAAVGQNDALQRLAYSDYQRYTCGPSQEPETKVLAAQQESLRQHGARFVDDVTDIRIDGDRATATVSYHFANAADDKRSAALAFAHRDGTWTVCSAYP